MSLDNNYTVGRLTVDAGDTLNAVNNTEWTVSAGAFAGSGSLVNNGTINFNDAGSGTFLHFAGSGSITGTGTVNLNGSNSRIFANNAGDRLTVGASQTVAGVGNLGNGNTVFTNNGTVIANVNGRTLMVQPGGGTADFTNNGSLYALNVGTLQFSNASGGTLTNNGTFYVSGGSTLSVPTGALTNLSGTTLTGGTYLVTSASTANPATLSFGGSIVTNHAYINLAGPGSVFNEVNALATNGNGGTFALSDGRNFTTAGALTNAGSVVVSGGSTLTVAGPLNNSGTAQVGGNGTSITVQGNVTNSGTITASQGTFTAQGTLTNSGVLQAGFSQGAIIAAGALMQTATGTLYGFGPVTAPTLTLDGSLRPGDSATFGVSSGVGTLTLSGQVGLLGDTTLIFDLGSTSASDQIKVNGTLTVNAVAGFGAGHYDLIDYTGTLTNNGLALGTLPAGYTYSIDTGVAGQVDLVVTNTVPGGGFLASALRRRDAVV